MGNYAVCVGVHVGMHTCMRGEWMGGGSGVCITVIIHYMKLPLCHQRLSGSRTLIRPSGIVKLPHTKMLSGFLNFGFDVEFVMCGKREREGEKATQHYKYK